MIFLFFYYFLNDDSIEVHVLHDEKKILIPIW